MLKSLVTAAGLFAVSLATSAAAETKVSFALDWKFEGPSAAYFAAIDNGHFKAAGLDVEVAAGKGSLDAIPKVATGAFPFGFADINSLAKFLDQNPGAPVIAVMMRRVKGLKGANLVVAHKDLDNDGLFGVVRYCEPRNCARV